MRYLLAVIDHEGNMGTDTEMAAIDAFNAGLAAGGHLLLAVGIAGPSTAVTIDNRDGVMLESVGPVNDVVEYMSGFWLVDANDHEHALDMARRGSLACNRKVEVRALLGG